MTFILLISSIEKKKKKLDKDLTGNLQKGKNNKQPKIPRFLQIEISWFLLSHAPKVNNQISVSKISLLLRK
jgi:hypothetical protein